MYAGSASLEGCRDELEEVLEEWIFLRIYRSLLLPEVDGMMILRQAGVTREEWERLQV